jgi:hypothetical protein
MINHDYAANENIRRTAGTFLQSASKIILAFPISFTRSSWDLQHLPACIGISRAFYVQLLRVLIFLLIKKSRFSIYSLFSLSKAHAMVPVKNSAGAKFYIQSC